MVPLMDTCNEVNTIRNFCSFLKHFKPITPEFQFLQNNRESVLQPRKSFFTVMEYYYRTVFDIFEHICDACVRTNTGVKVAAQNVPHNNFHFREHRLDFSDLSFSNPPVRRPEEI